VPSERTILSAHRDAARSRKRIVQAARHEFAARGFAGARLGLCVDVS